MGRLHRIKAYECQALAESGLLDEARRRLSQARRNTPRISVRCLKQKNYPSGLGKMGRENVGTRKLDGASSWYNFSTFPPDDRREHACAGANRRPGSRDG
jgi:hypothetical protein